MRKSIVYTSLVVMAVLLASSGILVARTTNAFANGQSAAIVIGQPNFTASGHGNVSASTLYDPAGIAFDSSGNLWVADSANGRILEFKAPLSTGESASTVLGESNFTTAGFSNQCSGTTIVNPSCLTNPWGLAFDSSGNLWVSDNTQYRILEFNAPFTNGENASIVLGQPSLTQAGTGNTPSASNLNQPAGISFDSSGNLWVADTLWNRVLEFKTPFSTGESASLVLGQDNFTSGTNANWAPGCPQGTDCPTASSLSVPFDVKADSSGNIWVADKGVDRILQFTSPFTNGESASLVLGSTNFTTWGSLGRFYCSVVSPNQYCLSIPYSLTFDSSGRMWVADTGYNRAVSFNPPFSTNQNESTVLGFPDYVSSGPISQSANDSNLLVPGGVAVDSMGNVWVSDSGQNRVVEFPASTTASSSSQSTVAMSSSQQTSSSATSTTTPTTTTSSTQGGGSSFPVTYIAIAGVVVVALAATAFIMIRRGRV
ncbi:MAG TPA: NHL repeat-containing protein, partial [Nitrososphaerales archaeon]|nr:NHL repeat-containing protein [Nitrososphaerales archaeon]